MTLEGISKLIEEARAARSRGDRRESMRIQIMISGLAPSLRQLWDFDKVFLDEGLGDRPSEVVAQRILDIFDSSQIQPGKTMTKPTYCNIHTNEIWALKDIETLRFFDTHVVYILERDGKTCRWDESQFKQHFRLAN